MIISARLFATLLIAVAVAACGGGDESESAGVPNAATETQSEAKDADDSNDGCDGQPIVNEKRDGIQVTRHCGTATATVEFDGTKTTFDAGSCQKTDESITINVGATVTDIDATQEQRDAVDYLGINVGRFPQIDPDTAPATKDGTYSEGIIMSGSAQGRAFPLTSEQSVTLTDDRSAGTFTAQTPDGELRGEFDCG